MIRSTKTIRIPEHGLVVSELAEGLSVSQHGRRYVARKWRLTPEVISIIEIAHRAGLPCHWQHGHPRTSSSHHLSFSPSHDEKWVFVLGGEAKPPKVKVITFNKAYRYFIAKSGVSWRWEWSGGENIFIQPASLRYVLSQLTPDLTAAVQEARKFPERWYSKIAKTGLNSEYLVEQTLIDHLKLAFKASNFELFVRPVHEGLIPDLIIKGPRKSVILELKLDIAGLPALEQISAYMKLDSIRNSYGTLIGGIVARDFHPDLVDAAESANAPALYRYHWDGKLQLTLVSGEDAFEALGAN